jgi:hypothetical protein
MLLDIFHRFVKMVEAQNATFALRVLSGCSHVGPVHEGLGCFDSMDSVYSYVHEVITTPTLGEQAMPTRQNTQANRIPYTTLDLKFTVTAIVYYSNS